MAAKIILLIGPAGSGKTSIARRIAQNDGWVHIEEDDLWVAAKKGHPPGELRTAAEQATVQREVLAMVLRSLSEGENVVLELIIYERQPRPLLFYQRELDGFRRSGLQVEVIVMALKPSVNAIMARQRTRARRGDADVTMARLNAKRQIACLNSKYISDDWLVDNSNDSLDVTYFSHFQPIVER